ncbi:sugar ABC transporter permease [Acuticoccus sp. M5D2P5]|uniref:carbohydrate ABC transporter permease n=1 Tax=Acuticoccus kalidii TaxID=2910977 RepID=UPI001F3A98AB|nr:sugar ABC transporter permease [Acuticoccus kalidii]MCF3935850.1 sugar ABC transporter permease [Acuticoccus kalidii]
MVAPYLVVFALFVIYPVGYGFFLGSNPQSYIKLLNDPIFYRTMVNTLVFLIVAVNLKLFLALLISGFLASSAPWVRWLSFIFILPWAIPSVVTILSFRWMLNAEWGLVNNVLWDAFQVMGPAWLIDPVLAFGAVILVHIWKYLPFWTLILLAGRLAISKDLYEAASIDGAGRFQSFRFVTWPGLAKLYITSTILSIIFSVGDFNSVYLLTGGGPGDKTHVLATLGVRYAFGFGDIETGMATVIIALPLLIPFVWIMIRRMRSADK